MNVTNEMELDTKLFLKYGHWRSDLPNRNPKTQKGFTLLPKIAGTASVEPMETLWSTTDDRGFIEIVKVCKPSNWIGNKVE